MLLALTFLTGTATAQSDAELRRENERLRERIRELEERIKALEEALQSSPTTPTATPPTESPKATDGEAPTVPPTPTPPPTPPAPQPPKISNPMELPEEATSAAVVVEYERLRYLSEFGAAPVELGANPGAQQQFLKRLDAWTIAEAKAWRRVNVAWTLRLVRAVRSRDGSWAVTGVEAETPEQAQARQDRGEPEVPIQFTLRPRQGDRIRGPLESLDSMRVTGTLLLNLRMDPDRAVPGPFRQNSRPFVGPYCDAVFSIQVKTVEPISFDGP